MSHWDNADPLVRKLVNLKVHDKDWVSVAHEEGYRAAKFMEWDRTRRILRQLREGGQPYIADRFESGMRLGAMDRRAMLKSSIGGSWAETKAKFGRDARKKSKAKARKKRLGKPFGKNAHYFNVWAEYPIKGQMGLSAEADYLLRKTVGRTHSSFGSGSGFGVRDMDWNFKSKAKAMAVAKRLLKLKSKIRGLSVRVTEINDGDFKTILGKKSPRESKAAKTKIKPFAVMFNMSGNYVRHAMMYVGKKPSRKTASFNTFAQAFAVAMALSKKNKAPYYFVTHHGASRGSMVKAVVHRGKAKRVKS